VSGAAKRYSVSLTPPAVRDITGIRNQSIKRRIGEAIDGLETNPRPNGVEKLTGVRPPIYRIRVGDYRILYDINDTAVTVAIARVGDRKMIYRR
jgi:mRNA interferase RelE/StbE